MNVMVLVDRDAGSIDDVAEAARRSGLRVERVMRGMRTIVGSVGDRHTLERLRGIAGVSAVRAEGDVTLPPMDPSVPQ